VPGLKDLAARYKDQGLVLIGVHTANGGEQMAGFVEKQGIDYPVAIDRPGKLTVGAFAVDSFPDYYVVDRGGNLRVADLQNGALEATVQMLLAEPAPSSLPTELTEAAERAVRKDKRLLVLLGGDDDRAAFNQVSRLDRALRRELSNEYETVPAPLGGPLAAALGVTATEATALALDARGAPLGSIAMGGLDRDRLWAFAREHKVASVDAELILARALAQATQEKKRVLVHLGAPW
jgi:hypothetical protein